MDMTLDEFEAEVSQQFDQLPEEVVGGLENVVFVVEDRPGDGAMDLLGTYEGHDRFGRAEYGYGQLPDVVVIFRDPADSIGRRNTLSTEVCGGTQEEDRFREASRRAAAVGS